MSRGATILCALLCLAACSEMGSDVEELEEGGSGKADNASSTATSEPLELETLQRIACEAVAMNTAFPADADRQALMGRCHQLDFTVVRKTLSELYDHSGSRLQVTLEMDVTIADGAAEHQALLFRVYNLEEQRFVWRGTVASPLDDAGFVSELAAAGAGALNADPLWRFHLSPATWEDMPVRVSQSIDAALAAAADASRVAQPTRVRRNEGDIGWIAPIAVGTTMGRIYLGADGTVIATDPTDVL